MKFHITPHTKIMDILNEFPDVEDYLISLVPAFVKLKNPILRNTIGKLATVEQAARVGEVELPFLINSLNQKLRLVPESNFSDINNQLDDWEFDEQNVTVKLNADEIINKGDKPVAVVLGALSKLKEKEILRLDCSFYPAPLIDKAIDAGFKTLDITNEDSSHSIYIRKSS